MIKIKRKKRNHNNSGNTFIMVVATISFLMVLLSAILVAVALCYRLKAYDINTRDNFYYLEQAMDEIYAGVGGDAITILNRAYDDTLEVMVYYDTTSKTYVTMDNDQANTMLKTTYMNMLKNDENYIDYTSAFDRLQSFISNPKSGSNKEGVLLSIGEYKTGNPDYIEIKDVVLKREAEYSTVNARAAQNGSESVAAGDTFIQTITTDIIIGKPQFNVSFNSISSDLNVLYTYSVISDMGIEIYETDSTGKIKTALGDKVSITGNIYAAADFYNKTYNENPGSVVTIKTDDMSGNVSTTVEGEQIEKVNSYSDDKLKDLDGVNTRSRYSGIYIDGASVMMAADRIIVPGMISALNCADLTVTTVANASSDYTDVWADGIVLDGYALKQDKDGTVTKGSSINMKAKAYIYDDLEMNAKSSKFLLNGQYFGYNYASTDNRKYSNSALDVSNKGGRKFTVNTDEGITDGQGIIGQAHYNSSAIILNGEDTELDLTLADALYIAGQSYIETSKNTKTKKDASGKKDEVTDITYSVITDELNNKTTELTDQVTQKVESYATLTKDDSGKITDNYTVGDGTKPNDKTAVQDYRTGEAISIKSNQLAYIPNWAVHDETDGIYVTLPAGIQSLTKSAYKDIWDNMDEVPLIKTVVSGKPYYYLDFSKATKDTDVMNEFLEAYVAMFNEKTVTSSSGGNSDGEIFNMENITNYENFKVKELKISNETDDKAYDNIYTNSAITTVVGDERTFKVKAKSSNIKALEKAMKNINDAVDDGNNVADKVAQSDTPSLFASSITSKLQDQYKEVKWLLTNSSTNGTYVTEAHNLAEEIITPINHYFDFDKITSGNSKYIALECGYGVWISDGDVKIGASKCTIGSKSITYSKEFSNGGVKGVVLCKGDVTFDTDVNEFEGIIVSGGKIIISNFDKSKSKTKMTIMANEEVVKTALRECDFSRDQSTDKNYGYVCDIFRLFESQYVEDSNSEDTPVVSMKSVSSVQFEDIISLRNWKKNVD